MDKCIDCSESQTRLGNCISGKVEQIKKILLCELCDEKLNMRIKKKMRDNWNWPFDRNDQISKQQMINHN